jgi:hypothetical protein
LGGVLARSQLSVGRLLQSLYGWLCRVNRSFLTDRLLTSNNLSRVFLGFLVGGRGLCSGRRVDQCQPIMLFDNVNWSIKTRYAGRVVRTLGVQQCGDPHLESRGPNQVASRPHHLGTGAAGGHGDDHSVSPRQEVVSAYRWVEICQHQGDLSAVERRCSPILVTKSTKVGHISGQCR